MKRAIVRSPVSFSAAGFRLRQISHGPKRPRYSNDVMNAFAILELMQLSLRALFSRFGVDAERLRHGWRRIVVRITRLAGPDAARTHTYKLHCAAADAAINTRRRKGHLETRRRCRAHVEVWIAKCLLRQCVKDDRLTGLVDRELQRVAAAGMVSIAC